MDARWQMALRAQGAASAAMGSRFTAALMQALAEVWPASGPLPEWLAGFAGDLGPSGASAPLRLAGGLHALVRLGRVPGLAACYPPAAPDPAALAQALRPVLAAEAVFLCHWGQSAPQTNEVGRSAVLLALAPQLAARFGLPLVLSELGASAGLNLWFDRYALALPDRRRAGLSGHRLGAAQSPLCLTPDWRGAAPQPGAFAIAARRGVDLNPLDPRRDGARLMAFVWPDQTDRLARLAAALHLAEPGYVDRGDAAGWLATRLQASWPGALHLVYHTIAHQYFAPETQAGIAAAMAQAGARATASAPLAWLAMEADGGEGAALTLRLWPGDLRIPLGRAGFHGQWLDWRGVPEAGEAGGGAC